MIWIAWAMSPEASVHDDSAGGSRCELAMPEGLDEAMQSGLVEGGKIIDLLKRHPDRV